MLLEDKVKKFTDFHQSHRLDAYNFYYKDRDGKFVWADDRTASIAGVEKKLIVNNKETRC